MGVQEEKTERGGRYRRIARWLVRTWVGLLIATLVFLGLAAAFPGEALNFGWWGVIGILVILLLLELIATLPLLIAAVILENMAKRSG